MIWKDFVQNVKDTKLPYYLSDSADHLESSNCKRLRSRLLSLSPTKKQLASHLSNKSNGQTQADGLSYISDQGKSSEGYSPKSPNKQTVQAYLEKLTQEFFLETQTPGPKRTKRIKCSSLERVSICDLRAFYKYNHSTKRVKKMCDNNLWLQMNSLKEIYSAETADTKRVVLLEVGRLILQFIYSSVNQLRFDQCRYILEKLGKAESHFSEGQNLKHKPSNSMDYLPTQFGSFLKPKSANLTKGGSFSGFPFSNSIGSVNSPHSIKRKPANERVLNLIATVKYITAQMAHLLHYDELSNRITSFLTKGHMELKNNRGGGTNTGSLFASIAMNLEDSTSKSKIDSMQDDPACALILQSKNLKDYFYNTHSFLDDFNEQVVTARSQHLQKYSKYKMQKWKADRDREKIEQKYEDFKIVCRICAQKVQVDRMMEHSGLCRKKAELDKEIKDFDNKISDTVFKAVMRSKEVHTKYVVDNNKYKKLKRQMQDDVDEANIKAPHRELNLEHKLRRDLSSSFYINNDSSPSDFSPSPVDNPQRLENKVIQGHASRFKKAAVTDLTIKIASSEGAEVKISQNLMDRANESLSQPHQDSDRSHNSGIKLQDNEDSESVISHEIRATPTMHRACTIDFTSVSGGLRRHSESKPTINLHSALEKKNQIYSKRKQIFQIESDALQKVLLNFNETEKLHLKPESQEKEVHSARMHSSSSSDDYFSDDHQDSSSYHSGAHSNEESSPMITHSKSITPNTSKSIFFIQNKFNNDSEEEKKEPEMVQAGTRMRRMGNGTWNPKEDAEKEAALERMQKIHESSSPKKQIWPQAIKKKMSLLEKKDDLVSKGNRAKLNDRMVKVRKDLNKKQAIMDMYTMIKDKGKMLINKAPYLKSHEMTQNEANQEAAILKQKIDDKDAIEFVDTFLALLNDRVTKGKLYRDTKRELNRVDGVIDFEQTPKASYDRRHSLMKGGGSQLTAFNIKVFQELNARKSDNSVRSSYSLSKASLRITQEVVEEDSPLITRAQTLREKIKIPMFIQNDDDGSSRSPQTANFSGRLLLDEKSPQFKSPIKPDLITEEKSKSNSFSSSNSNSSSSSPSSRKSKLSGEAADEDNDNEEEAENLDQKPAQRVVSQKTLNIEQSIFLSPPKNIKSAYFFKSQSRSIVHDKQVTSIRVGSGLLNETSSFGYHDKTSIVLHEKGSLILHDNTPRNKDDNTTSLMFECEEQPGHKGHSKSSVENLSGLSREDISVPRPRKAGHELTFKPTIPNIDPEQPIKEDVEEEQKQTSPFLRKRCHTTLIVRPPLEQAINIAAISKGSLDSHIDSQAILASRGRNRAVTSPCKIEPIGLSEQLRRSSIIIHASGRVSILESEKESRVPSVKSGSRVFEDFCEESKDRRGRDEIGSIILPDTFVERGYHSDSQLKNSRIHVNTQQMIGMNDFEPLKMIGRGAFGRVFLVRRKATNDLYAMKVINLTEKFMKNTKELENLRKENKVFGLAKEDFVVRAVFTFTYKTCICFVMEYMIGGDFGDILYNYSALEEDVARFYIAEIILAVEYLHSLGIVHRDLKPDNILLNKNGHAKLTDFGLSDTGLSQKIKAKNTLGEANSYQEKIQAINQLCANMSDLKINLKVKGKVMEKKLDIMGKATDTKDGDDDEEAKATDSKNSLTSPRGSITKKRNSKRHHRLIGTPDYMAPEIILGASISSYSIDWWSLGCILFEFLVGIPPFNDDSPEKIYDNIVHLKIPWDQINIGYGEDSISPQAADLIHKLLTLDHTKRLGSNGVAEIKEHKFFEGINWANLRQQQPPIIPEQKDETDTTNFVRLAGKVTEKEKDDFFAFLAKDSKTTTPNLEAVRQILEAASDFNTFNIAALDSDNKKSLEEALKQREEEFKAFAGLYIADLRQRKTFYEDLFDEPEQ